MSYEKNARVINDDIFDLVNSCFEKERSSAITREEVVEILIQDVIFLMKTRIILF